jgi:hypothetical protein
MVWSGDVALKSDFIVPKGETLIIMPGTRIYGVYDYNNEDGITPSGWRIIVYGNLSAAEDVVFDAMPRGLSAVKIPINSEVKTITIAPKKIETEKVRQEFSTFRTQYLILWTLLFGSIYYAIKSRKN